MSWIKIFLSSLSSKSNMNIGNNKSQNNKNNHGKIGDNKQTN